jgi:outer membrane lipoprotein-sorting protein
MNVLRSLALSALTISLSASWTHTQANPPQLKAILSQLNDASKKFKNVRADSHSELYEKVIRTVSTVQNGPIYFERSGSNIQMGAVINEGGTTAKPKVLQYKNGMLSVFDPGFDQITVFRAGDNKDQVESFLTLGFGGSGTDLADSWDITDLGSENMSDDGKSIKLEKLDLIPKDPGVKNLFQRVTIWIDLTRDVPLKQIFYTPSGDYRTATYSNIKLNGKIDYGTFKIHTDNHTTTIYH